MFSKSAEYALRAVIYLAQKSSEDHKIGIAELADAIGSPQSFTAKILQNLTRHNALISSSTGPGGGFYLTAKAKKKSLLSVVALLEEEDVIKGCVLGLKECSEINPCPLHSQYKHIRPQLVSMLENKTIQDMADEMRSSRVVIHHALRRQRKG